MSRRGHRIRETGIPADLDVRERQEARTMPRVHQIDPSLEVLIVDDDTDVRELLVEFFRDLDFSVASASDGRAAITAIEREPHRYWLVVTDIIMPGADGLAVLRAARTANPDLNVVIVTGYASLDTAVEAVRLGAADYLSKPFTIGQIEVMVRRLTERVSLRQENQALSSHVRGRRAEDHVLGRLDTIGNSLDRLESLLEQMSTRNS